MCWPPLRVQLKKLRLRPDVGRVCRGIKRHVANQLHTLLPAMRAQRVPLPVKQILQAGKKRRVLRQLPAGLLQRRGLSHTQRLVRPCEPGTHAEPPLQSHEQRIIRKPVPLLVLKAFNLCPPGLQAGGAGLLQHGKAAAVELSVIHQCRIVPPVDRLQRASLKQPLLCQQLQVDQIGVSGKAGKALIRRVSTARRPHRKHLPEPLPGLRQKIGKGMALTAQRANAIRRRQRRDMHQEPGGTFYHKHLPKKTCGAGRRL